MKILPLGAEVLQSDGQMDLKLIFAVLRVLLVICPGV